MHEGVSGYGAFQREWRKFQKRAATTAERSNRAAILAREKRTAPNKPSESLWDKVKGWGGFLSPLGLGVPGGNSAGERALVKPAVDAAGKAAGGLWGSVKWIVGGLVFVAAVALLRR